MISEKVDCSKCPSLCCYSLTRPNNGRFLDAKKAGEGCRELSQNCSCKIHDSLKQKSPGCQGYSCFGGGQIIVQKFGLDSQKICTDTRIQGIFVLAQSIMRRLWKLEELIRRYPEDDQENSMIREFIDSSQRELDLLDETASPIVWGKLDNKIAARAWVFLE